MMVPLAAKSAMLKLTLCFALTLGGSVSPGMPGFWQLNSVMVSDRTVNIFFHLWLVKYL